MTTFDVPPPMPPATPQVGKMLFSTRSPNVPSSARIRTSRMIPQPPRSFHSRPGETLNKHTDPSPTANNTARHLSN